MSRSFINQLKKEVLLSSFRDMGLDEEGTVDELRARLRNYLDKGNIPKEHIALIEKLRTMVEATEKELKVPITKQSRSSSPSGSRERPETSYGNYSEVCDKVRKWGVKYDGGKDPLSFLDRIDELATCYSIPPQILLGFMPELLKGDALSWYRNTKDQWKCYNDFTEDFKLFFLPPRFFENLEDDIRNRKQRADESFVDYVTAIQTLMRLSKLSCEDQLERIFCNCRSEYKLYVKRRDFSKLGELILLAKELESIRIEEADQRKNNRRLQTAVAANNDFKVCYRCGEPGHTRRTCSNAQSLFCWDCGKKDVKTIDCCRRGSGNFQRGPSTEEGRADL